MRVSVCGCVHLAQCCQGLAALQRAGARPSNTEITRRENLPPGPHGPDAGAHAGHTLCRAACSSSPKPEQRSRSWPGTGGRRVPLRNRTPLSVHRKRELGDNSMDEFQNCFAPCRSSNTKDAKLYMTHDTKFQGQGQGRDRGRLAAWAGSRGRH